MESCGLLALEPNNCSLKKKYFCSSKESSLSTFDPFTTATLSYWTVNRNNTIISISKYMTTTDMNGFSKTDNSGSAASGSTDSFRTATDVHAKYQHRQTIGRTSNQTVLSWISLCLSIITLILVAVIVIILYRLRKRVNMSSKLSFSNGASQRKRNGAPSHADGIYYDNENHGVNIAPIRHETGDISNASHANENDANYVNAAGNKSRCDHVYEGLANERVQHTYEYLSK